jgi:MoaD family protein
MSMRKITIHFFSNFRTIANTKSKEYDFDLDEVTVRDLLERVAKDYPEMEPFIFNRDRSISDSTSVLVNGEDIRGLENDKTVLSESDRITMFKAVGGG